eukprot:CAMPEP_0175284712 /NCGR_PEP_ID=MMETSP0093-20121207/52848_1 /TAXON_ID=311494 /ORGANISM="Alexandrium monilatum, Strain CCMP3105" /LENGTH=38 /DNA_ID= /DNA_START= /DNA_END= /DNA_ORIENTATION=
MTGLDSLGLGRWRAGLCSGLPRPREAMPASGCPPGGSA